MEHGEIKEAGGGGIATSSSSAASRKGSSGSHEVLKCPRCDSLNTKFCYYNNYNLSQPRHFCKNCRRYWTKGGSLRSVPVGGGCRKNKRSRHGSSGPNASSAIHSNLPSSVNLLDVGHLSGSGGATTSAFLHSVPPHLLQLHDYASASSAAAAANHNNFGLTFSRLQESMRSSPSASLMMPAHSYEPLNLNPHLNLDQTSLVNHLGIYNNNSNTLNTTSCTNTTNTNTNHNNHNPPPATDLSLLIDDHHRPFTANTTSTAPAAAHAEWSKLHADHHPHKLGLTSNCMQLMQMNDHDHDHDNGHDHGHGHGHGHHGFGHIIPPPGFPEEEKPLTGQSNTMDQQQHQWFQGGVQQMESGILQEGWAWPDFFSLAGSAAGTIP